MSNSNEPTRPASSDQPDPKQPEATTPAKPQDAPAASGGSPERSSFDFQLPEGVGSVSDLPPLLQPADTTPNLAIPPRPQAVKPSANTFDFADLPGGSTGSLADIGLEPKPIESADELASITPADDALAIPPELLSPPAGGSDSEFSLAAHLPSLDSELPSMTLRADPLDLAALGKPQGPPSDAELQKPSVPDIASLLPPPPAQNLPADLDPFAAGEPAFAEFELPIAEPISGMFAAPVLPDVLGADPSADDLELPFAEPASDIASVPRVEPPEHTARASDSEAVLGELAEPIEPVVPASGWLDRSSAHTQQTPVGAGAAEEPVEAILEEPVAPVKPASGWLDQSSVAAATAGPAEAEPVTPPPETKHAEAKPADVNDIPPNRSSFDFRLPEGADSVHKLPVPEPDVTDTRTLKSAIPPRPAASPTAPNTFDFSDSADSDGPRTNIKLDYGSSSDASDQPLRTVNDHVTELPAEPPARGAGGPAPADLHPVAPASGWLDPDEAPPAPAEPGGGAFDLLPEPPAEGSDIFSGSRTHNAQSVEHSDIIAATAFGPAPPPGEQPAEPARLSDVALTFEGPSGGSTLHDSGASDLPLADEVAGATEPLAEPPEEGESIHDMPDPSAADPLFDSAKLADAPDLPAAPRTPGDDAPEYGRQNEYTGDASSILADLSAPEIYAGHADSSSVRVEAPGVDRTFTDHPADGAFDLTVPDQPIPDDLFEGPADLTAHDATDWQSHGGSDLFAEGRTAPELPLDEDKVEPVDLDLTGEPPLMSSATSSIFSSPEPLADAPEPDSILGDDSEPDSILADLAIGDPDQTEFADHPALLDDQVQGGENSPEDQSAYGHGPGDFELPHQPAQPAGQDEAIDWESAALAADEEATRGIPKDSSLSSILRGLADDSAETSTRDAGRTARPPAAQPAAIIDDDASAPMVTVDWLAGSSEEAAVMEVAKQPAAKPPAPKPKDKGRGRDDSDSAVAAAASEVEKSRPPRRAADRTGEKAGKPEKSRGGMGVGMLIGMLVACTVWAGLYFGGTIPNSEKVQLPPPGNFTPQQQGPGTPQPGGPAVPPAAAAPDATAAFAAGDGAKALEMVKAAPAATPEGKANAGRIRVYSKIQEHGTDEDLKQGQADLKSAIESADKSPEGVMRAVRATVDLGISYEATGDREAAHKLFTEAKAKFPSYAAVFDALLDRLNAPPTGPGTSFLSPRITPADAEKILLAVGILLADTPAQVDDPEPGIYYWKAVKLAGEGKYGEAIELIGKAKAAHLKRAKKLAGRGLNPLTDPLEQMFPRACDELASYWKLRSDLYSNPAVAASIKKNGLGKTLDSFAQAERELAATKAGLKAASAQVTKLETEVAKLGKDVKATEKARLEVEDKLKTATADLAAAQKQLKEQGDLLASVATELNRAVPLPEKWAPADLVAGAKTAASRATGPDLKKLVPNAMTAIGGGGLSTGQLLEIADRLTKAEAAVKAATDKLAADTKKLNDKYDTDTTKLKTDHAAELKKLTDSYAADLKKLKDDQAAAIKELKDANAEGAKKLMDKFASDTKKLNDDHAAEIKAEQAKLDAEKAKSALREITFQKQLGNAVTPGQALDLWLPILTDLRRPADAEQALVIADRVLASSPPDSDDAAKAHTATGMAYLLKGDLARAKDEFQTARRSPAYKADKPWAKAADAGLQAVADPLAPYRQPVVIPPVDAVAATKALDAGIYAYREGKYKSAVTALADAAKNDPADPVSWYFLGAARWALGNREEAKKDFAQGAEREKVWPNPARTVSAAIAPIQGDARDALDKVRP